MKTKTDHIDTLAHVKQRKQDLKAIIHAEKQEMSEIAKSIQESLKPQNLITTFVNGLGSDDTQKGPIANTLESVIEIFTKKNSKLSRYVRIAVMVAPIVFKLIKLLKKKK
jgi:hypothetical protein